MPPQAQDEFTHNPRLLPVEPTPAPKTPHRRRQQQPDPPRRINDYWLTQPTKPAQPPKGKSKLRKTKGIPSAAIVPAGETKIQES